MPMSMYTRNKVLNLVFKGQAFTPPTAVYMALFTTNPTENGTGTEVSGGGYARQTVTLATSTAGTISSTSDVLFPIATAAYGTVTHVAFFDALTGGNMLYYEAVVTPKSYAIGDQPKFASGDITVTQS